MKKLFLILTALALLTVLVGCNVAQLEETLERAEDRIENALDNAESRVENAITPTPKATLSQEQAENIALEHAGLTREQVKSIHTEYDVDNARAEYDITLYAGDLEYEFEIHAENGQVLSYDTEPVWD